MKAKKGTKKPSTKQAPKTQRKLLRIERGEGITSQMKMYHNTGDNRILTNIKNTILNRYISQGMTINGQPKDLDYLVHYLQIDKKEVIKKIGENSEMLLGIKGSENGYQDACRALLSSAIFGALADRGLIQQQASSLLAAQNGQYVPFLTSSVNQALKNLLDSQKPILDILKLFTGTQQTNILLPQSGTQQTPGGVPNQKAISIQEAITMIAQENEGLSLLERPEGKLLLAERYLTDELPEVVATRQQGHNADLDVNVYQPKKVRKVQHTDRREVDEEIES